MATSSETLSWGGIGIRWVLALLLVLITWNPTGTSFVHWALMPVFGSGIGEPGANAPLKFLLGVILLAGWVLYLQATRRSLGAGGAVLVLALCVGVVWLLASWKVLAMQGTAIEWIVLVVLSIVLAMGMSWSHISRRMSGQIDTDEVQ
ncbi:MAG: DUF6524 family protein [Gemmatimonadales bacterium]